MTHEIFVDDTVVIRRKLEIPDRCPKCKRHYEIGDTVLKAQTLRPREEHLKLGTLLEGKVKRAVISVSSTKNTTPHGPNPRLIVEVRCLGCNYIHMAAHSRMYVLAEMDKVMAFKLRGLLYDSDVPDETAQRKCYDETQGYHGDCFACNIEAEIGTEEVPHPIDPRAHTCVRDPEHVQHQPK